MTEPPVAVWWNSRWGWAWRRIYVRATPGGYEVEAVARTDDRRVWDVPTNAQVAALLADLMAPEDDDPNDGWRDITSLYWPRAG